MGAQAVGQGEADWASPGNAVLKSGVGDMAMDDMTVGIRALSQRAVDLSFDPSLTCGAVDCNSMTWWRVT